MRLRVTSPAGTVIAPGAPKIRVMQLTADLAPWDNSPRNASVRAVVYPTGWEGTTRGPYGGCVVYFSFESLPESCEGSCGEGFWFWPRRRARSIPAGGGEHRANADQREMPCRSDSFAQPAAWLRCTSVEGPQGVWASQALQVKCPCCVLRSRTLQSPSSRLAIQPFAQKQHPSEFSGRLSRKGDLSIDTSLIRFGCSGRAAGLVFVKGSLLKRSLFTFAPGSVRVGRRVPRHSHSVPPRRIWPNQEQ